MSEPTEVKSNAQTDPPIKRTRFHNFLAGVSDVVICASTDSLRWHLNGVYLNFKAGTVVATNGHQIIELKVDFPNEIRNRTGVICHPDVFNYLRTISPKDRQLVDIEMSETGITLIESFKRTEFDFIKCEFPAYEQVMPKIADPVFLGINPTLLSKIKRAAGLEKSDGVVLAISQKDRSSPVVIYGHGERIGAVMPMRFPEPVDFRTENTAMTGAEQGK